jgi:aryl-alcohol dehydrogenase-like predicted oxidoreductase
MLTGKYRKGAGERLIISKPDGHHEDELTRTILDGLELVANEIDAIPGQVALSWILAKNGFPIIGARTLSHLEEGIKAIKNKLTTAQVKRLDEVSAITLGYPHDIQKTVQTVY